MCPNAQVLDCEGAFITPGGIDTHVHLEQWNTPTGDTWSTGTRSAICGGTTTVVAFASQNKNHDSVLPIVEEYGALIEGRAYADYAYHLILTNPTKKIVEEELPIIAKEKGVTSVKLYMTYDPLKLGDRQILDIMVSTRKLGMTTMVHAENHDMISLYVLLPNAHDFKHDSLSWMHSIIETLIERGQTEPYHHAVSRPTIAEAEATVR